MRTDFNISAVNIDKVAIDRIKSIESIGTEVVKSELLSFPGKLAVT